MRRREFIRLVGGSTAAWPLVARAQQPAMPVIGFLSAVSPVGFSERVRGFRQGLKDTGYVECENDKGCFPDLKSNIQVSVFGGTGIMLCQNLI